MILLNVTQADAVYDVLVTECGATDLPDSGGYSERAAFVRYMTDARHRWKEWRFSGDLGLGGKCRINSNHPAPYVDYYPEDRSVARDRMVRRANARISALFP